MYHLDPIDIEFEDVETLFPDELDDPLYLQKVRSVWEFQQRHQLTLVEFADLMNKNNMTLNDIVIFIEQSVNDVESANAQSQSLVDEARIIQGIIESYVKPTDPSLTYSVETIDEDNAGMLNAILRNSANIVGIKIEGVN